METTGKYCHRGDILSSTSTLNANSQSVVGWGVAPFASNVPCRVGGDGREEVKRAFGQQLDAHFIVKVTMRWLDGVTNGMRFVWHDKNGDRTFSIVSHPINPDGKNIEMVLMCKEGL